MNLPLALAVVLAFSKMHCSGAFCQWALCCCLRRKNQVWNVLARLSPLSTVPPLLLDRITLHLRACACLYICGLPTCPDCLCSGGCLTAAAYMGASLRVYV